MDKLSDILTSATQLQRHGYGTLTCIKQSDAIVHQSTSFIHKPPKHEDLSDFLMRVFSSMRDGDTLELVAHDNQFLYARVLQMPRA